MKMNILFSLDFIIILNLLYTDDTANQLTVISGLWDHYGLQSLHPISKYEPHVQRLPVGEIFSRHWSFSPTVAIPMLVSNTMN